MQYSTTIGIDTHSKKNEICAIITSTGEMLQTTLSEDPEEAMEWIRDQNLPKPVMAVYESGPTGFGLARQLNAAGIPCNVAATAKLPKRIDRKKNDRVDAEWLARQLISGSVHAVRIPTVKEESLRNLSRLRGEAARDLARAKQRVASFMLVCSVRFTNGKKRWTQKFRKWAEGFEFEQEADTFVFRDKLAEVYRIEERLCAIERKIADTISADRELTERMRRFQCIHGVGRITSFSLVCEINDFSRFKKPSSFAAFMGLVPSENSSGKKVAKGSITKEGNGHLRRILVEAAAAYSRASKIAKSTDEAVDPLIRAHAYKCSKRLRARHVNLKARGKQANKARVAIARELAEWIYVIAMM